MDNNHKVEALLNIANKYEPKSKGKLKIFLGYAPGVGKSYAMLNNAKSLLKDNKDIVVGLIVSHGRQDILSMIVGLEVIPSKKQYYRGQTFNELNVESIKSRRPEIVIIDELPHSNLPTARNKKRYSDIVEILDEGISVYTAINIQHIASMSHEITQITQATVNEIVPNNFIQSADEIVVVDVSPEELIKRLKQGKVYKSDAIDRALERYFQYTNLTILRDYTFRAAANHVGQDIQQYKHLYQNSSLIASSPTVLVCCDYGCDTPKVLRKGKLLATALNARLVAVYIKKPNMVLGKTNLRAVKRYKSLAQTLGYSIDHFMSDTLSGGVLEYARSIDATDIVVGKSHRAKWRDMLFGSVVYDLIRNSNGIQIHIVSIVNKSLAKQYNNIRERKLKKNIVLDSFKSVVISSTAGLLLFFGLSVAGLVSQTLSFLVVLSICSYRYGLIPSILSSFMGMLIYIYVFLSPSFVFHVYSIGGLLSFAFFMAIVVTSSQIIHKTKKSFTILRDRENSISVLYRFSKIFEDNHKSDDFRKIFLSALSDYFKCDFVFLNITGEDLEAAFPQHPNFNNKELIAAKWTSRYKSSSGRGTNTFGGLSWMIEPLIIDNRIMGVVGVYVKSDVQAENIDANTALFSNMLSQISHLLLKRKLDDQESRSIILEKQKSLQKSMLSSISHDLKTPLASIMGSLSSLRSYGKMFDASQQEEMVDLALTESKRLDRYIDNVIHMLRFKSGEVSLNIQAISSDEIMSEIEKTCLRLHSTQKITFVMPSKTFQVELDWILFQQVLLNLIDNAVKFTNDINKEIIVILSKTNSNKCTFEVRDLGAGIKNDDLKKIFTIFHRIDKEDSYTHGNGLGLSICKGIVAAHKGKILATSNGLNKGSCFRVIMPLRDKRVVVIND